MNAVQVIAAIVSLVGLFVAARSLVRLAAVLRTEHRQHREERRDSFTELLDQAEAERIRRQVDAEAERDQIPWR